MGFSLQVIIVLIATPFLGVLRDLKISVCKIPICVNLVHLWAKNFGCGFAALGRSREKPYSPFEPAF